MYRPSIVCRDVGVVAGGNRVEAEQIGALGQASELHRPIALDTRIRRDATSVRIDVRGNDVLVEVVAEVENEVIDPELLGDSAGIVDIGDRATTGVAVAAPQLHRDADDLVALPLQQHRRDRRVDAATHRAHHFHDELAIGDDTIRRRS